MKHFRHRRERGAILVTSLLLLLVLTVLGMAMMKMTNMQERMAGNTRDLNLALQAAEGALREAETVLAGEVSRPGSTAAAGCIYCQLGALPVNIDAPGVFAWEANAREFGVAGTIDFWPEDDRPPNARDPRYVVEEYMFDDDDPLEGSEPPTGRDFYTITSRSTGASDQANTVLQSTYARRF